MELTALGIDLISHTYWIYYPFLHLFKFRNIVILYIDFHVSICLFIYLLFTYFYGLTSSPLPSLILGFSFVAGSTSISRPLRTWDLTCDLCLDNQLYLQKTLNLDQRTQRHRLHYNLFTAILSWGIMSLLLGLWTPTLLFFTNSKTNLLVSINVSHQCHPAIQSCSSKVTGISSCCLQANALTDTPTVVDQIKAITDIQVLIPGTCKYYFIWKKGFCRWNWVKNLEMRDQMNA